MPLDRRTFFAATAALAAPSPAWGRGVADRLVVAQIGCGGQGRGLARSFAGRDDSVVAYVCDPDAERREESASEVSDAGGKRPRAVSDFRVALDDPNLDAVAIATPDHWHVPAALAALAAGKHVYVEKPCSHNVREGRALVEAAKRTGLVVQHGTQSRSSPLIAGAVQLLREGIIGDVLAAKAWNVQRRGDIGRMQPSAPPVGLDYDIWLGPAPEVPYQSNRSHYNWRWWYAFGCGDAGNDGVHEIDYARWGLGVEDHPARVGGVGGKYFFDDDQQFPDTLAVHFEYPGPPKKMLTFEMRLWDSAYPHNVDSGAEFFGTAGKMFVSKRGKFEVVGERNRKLDVPTPHLELSDHHANFLAACRGEESPRADALTAHHTATLAHLANLVARTGSGFQFDGQTESIPDHAAAHALLGREYRPGHWAIGDLGA